MIWLTSRRICIGIQCILTWRIGTVDHHRRLSEKCMAHRRGCIRLNDSILTLQFIRGGTFFQRQDFIGNVHQAMKEIVLWGQDASFEENLRHERDDQRGRETDQHA